MKTLWESYCNWQHVDGCYEGGDQREKELAFVVKHVVVLGEKMKDLSVENLIPQKIDLHGAVAACIADPWSAARRTYPRTHSPRDRTREE